MKAASEKPNPEMVFAQAEADKVRAGIVKTLTDAKVKTIDMGLKDDRERDKLDVELAVKAAELETKGAELDQNLVQMEIDATRPEEEKSSTENIPEPAPPLFPSMEPLPEAGGAPVPAGPGNAPSASPGPAPGLLPPKLDLPAGLWAGWR